MISINEHMTYMYNIQINRTITDHTCLHAWTQDISQGGGGDGVQAQYFPGVPNSGGIQLLFSIETCDFPGWEVRTYCPSLDLCMTVMHVSQCKAFKSHKNVSGSKFSKGIGGHGNLKKICRQNHSFYYIRFWKYLS